MSSWIWSTPKDKASLGSLWKKVKSKTNVQENFPALLFVPIASCPVTGHHWKDLGCIFFIPFHQVFTHIDKIHPRLLFCRLDRHSFLSMCQMLWSLNHLYGLPQTLVHGSPNLVPALKMCLTRVDMRERIPLLYLLATFFLMDSHSS